MESYTQKDPAIGVGYVPVAFPNTGEPEGKREVQHELLTEEVQEVISYRPHWIVRKGNTIFLLVVFLMLALTGIIKYPDIINSSARLVTLNPPKLVNAKAEGKLEKLFVANEQVVNKGLHLGCLESTADYNEVIQLKKWIDQTITATQQNEYDYLLNNRLPTFTALGELQTQYQQFQNQLEITKQTLASGYYQRKKNSLQKDLQYLAALKNNTAQQKQLQQQDKQLQQKEYEAYESLAKDKVIAPLELNQYKSKLITKEQNLEQLNAQITNSDISSLGKQKEMLDLQKQIADQHQQFRSTLLELKSGIEKWVQQYVLVAPEDGTLLFASSLQENEWISKGQGLFYIQPSQTKFYVEMMAGQTGIGKIKTGQRVMIKVEGYPSNEFGYLTATVNYISNIPSRADSFLLKAELQKGLQTNYGKTIFFRNGLAAQAEIITDDRKLFDRLAGQLKEIWKR